MVSLVSDAPYEVVRDSFREKPAARVKEIRLHNWMLGELSVRADKYSIFSLAFPYGEIDVTDVSSMLLVKARVVHAHDGLKRLVVPE